MSKKIIGLEMASLNEEKMEITKISKNSIAVIGLNASFASGGLQQFWQDICQGNDFIGRIPESRKRDTDSCIRLLNNNLDVNEISYREASYLQDIDKFDYRFFGLSPKEASLMDPHQRIFLETVWGMIEDAGYGGNQITGTKTGVYLGYSNFPSSLYFQAISMIDPMSLAVSIPGNLPSIIASRISYLLDLKGTNVVIDTACSSSLVAVHLACQGIRNGDCDQAIVGSIKINLMPIDNFAKMGIESSTGKTMTFDENSDGVGTGEGSIAILLKPLNKALQDKDHIYAVIAGSATNQDGSSAGLTAPNVLAQRDVIIAAWKAADINPESISYIEAHGTATKLGDPIEIDGITQAFRKYTDHKQFCAIGSVKSNLGHLDCAAGLAGLVKSILALKNGILPPTIHFNTPNSKISFEDSPVYVNNQLTKWETNGQLKRCGVSSFGLSGTNCHVVLEEAPQSITPKSQINSSYRVFTISAKSESALKELLQRYKIFFKNNNSIDLDALCYTAGTGRWHYQYRLAFIIKDIDNLQEQIIQFESSNFMGNTNGIPNVNNQTIYYQKGEYKSDQVFNQVINKDNEFAKQLINEIKNNKENIYSLLQQLCQLYIQGAEIDWNLFYKNGDYQKISLPTYPFEKERCWLAIPEEKQAETLSDNMYYQINWIEKGRKQIPYNENDTIVIVRDHSNTGNYFCEHFRKNGKIVIEVELGANYLKESENHYFVNGSIEDYQKLLNDIDNSKFLRIFHMLTLENHKIPTGLKEVEASLERGVYNLFNLVKAIYNSLNQNIKYEIILISKNVARITGQEDDIHPENAALFGFGKVVNLENSQIRCRCIDLDQKISWDEVISEVETDSQEYQVAFRNGKRYVIEFKKQDISAIETNEIPFRNTGVYIITGGTGGIGLTIAKYLASQGEVNIALINRSRFVERENWESLIHSGEDLKIREKVLCLLEIEKMGSHVHCYSADVTNEIDLTSVLGELRKKYGRINGIIHSAGIAGNGFIFNKQEEDFRNVLAPKINGTWLLDQLTAEDDLDFFILFSSLTSVFGALGQSDYTAANSYLDFYVSYHGHKISTISWPAWKDVGMAVDFGVNIDGFFKAITNDQAIQVFDQVFHKLPPFVLVGEINYSQISLDLMSTPFPFDFSEEIKVDLQMKGRKSEAQGQLFKKHLEKKNYNKHPLKEVELKGKETDNYTIFEKIVAKIWCEVLGFEILNVEDNFFELGGNSVLLIRVESLLLEQFPNKITITDLFTYPTISKLAEYLSYINDDNHEDKVKQTEKFEDQEIDNLINEVTKGNISIEEAVNSFYSSSEDIEKADQ